jgi:GT2 family glycosyltransferase
MSKILIGIVTYDGKDYCFPKFARFLRTITFPDIDIVFVDNSRDKEHVHVIKKEGFNVIWHRRGNTEQEIMANCNEWLREYAILHGFSHLLNLESDIFPPPDFLELMMAYGKQVIGLPYFIGQSFLSCLLQFENENTGFERQLIPMSNARSFFIANGKLRKSMQIGLGCLLMSAPVLKQIRFVLNPQYAMYHADSSLHIQLQQLSIPVYLCPEYYCVHYNRKNNTLFTNDDIKESAKYKDYPDD